MKQLYRGSWWVGSAAIWLAAASSAWAQGADRGRGLDPSTIGWQIVSTLIFGLIGIALAILGFKLFDVVSPFNLEQEICEKQNLPVALVCAGMVIGICLIVAAAVL